MSKYRKPLPESAHIQLQAIKLQIENMNPGEHIVIPSSNYSPAIESQLRSHVSRINRYYKTNFKIHHHSPDASLWVWYSPDPFKRRDYTHTPHIPSGSIHAPLYAILSHLNITEEQFNSYSFDHQMSLRIKAGIALRNERVQFAKLSKQFKSPIPKLN